MTCNTAGCACSAERTYCLTQGETLSLEVWTSDRGTVGDWSADWFSATGGFDVASVTLNEVAWATVVSTYPDIAALLDSDGDPYWGTPDPDFLWQVVIASTPAESRAATPGHHPFQVRIVSTADESIVLRGTVTLLDELTA